MSKKQDRRSSSSRLVTGSAVFTKKRKSRKIKLDNVKVHKSSLYYVADEPNSRIGILEKFLDFLLEDKIKMRIPLLRKIECKESGSNDSVTEMSCVARDYRDIEEVELEHSNVVGVEGSNFLMKKGSSQFLKTSLHLDTIGDGLKITQEQKFAEGSTLPKIERPYLDTSISADVPKHTSYPIYNASIHPLMIRLEQIIFFNGNVYEGQTNEYLMHGNGKLTWEDNTVYEGDFQDGYITGKGDITLTDLSTYQGEFCNGFFHGKGFLNVASTPIYYYGDWKSGRKDGNGWILYSAGEWYEGEWRKDMRHGNGYRMYKNGAKYKGDWVDNKKQGKGKMLFHNNDYYSGEWYEDMLNGYGEYTWDIVYNKTFCFPVYNWYKGAWKNGERDGIGIMNFGTECGAKYAGTWRNNFKHGPGVMICGNGLVLESNPLFEYDKPIHKSAQISLTRLLELNEEITIPEAVTEKSSYYDVLKLINSQTACAEFDGNILAKITANSENIPPHMFVKLSDSISGNKKIWCPLNIPTHTIAEDVDLKYFVDLTFEYTLKNSPSLEHENGSEFHRKTLLVAKYNNSISESEDSLVIDPREEMRLAKAKELKKLKNTIIIYLLKLKIIYEKYAAFAKSKSMFGDINLDFKPVLVRFFLWQLLRDLGITNEGVQLVDIDLLLWENPASCLDTKHYPFEPIYFYQFVMYLFGAAWLSYKIRNKKNAGSQVSVDNVENSIPSTIFRNFLDTKLESVEMLRGSSLGDHLNIVSLNGLYNVYAGIAEPMTVKSFLNATYRSMNKALPCYQDINRENYLKSDLRDGYNAVPVAHDVYFIHEPIPVNERNGENNQSCKRTTLFTFRTLGKKKILETVTKICPKFTSKNLYYRITFLEFYEIIVLLAIEKAEEEIIKKDQVNLCKILTTSEISYRSKMKKKKTK